MITTQLQQITLYLVSPTLQSMVPGTSKIIQHLPSHKGPPISHSKRCTVLYHFEECRVGWHSTIITVSEKKGTKTDQPLIYWDGISHVLFWAGVLAAMGWGGGEVSVETLCSEPELEQWQCSLSLHELKHTHTHTHKRIALTACVDRLVSKRYEACK